MNEASKERGHTYWEPMWKGGLVGIFMGGMLALVLALPVALIVELLSDGHIRQHTKELAGGLTCLWAGGWATYWVAHSEGREFGWWHPNPEVEERKFKEWARQEGFKFNNSSVDPDESTPSSRFAAAQADDIANIAVEHRRKMIRDGEAGVTSWRMTAETFLLQKAQNANLLQKAQNAKLTAENTRLKKKLATLRT